MRNQFKAMTCALALLFTGTAVQAGFVDSGGREWRSPNDLGDVTWAALDASCWQPGDAGARVACIGSVNSVDLTGWTWASQSEVSALLQDRVTAHGGVWGATTTFNVSLASAVAAATDLGLMSGSGLPLTAGIANDLFLNAGSLLAPVLYVGDAGNGFGIVGLQDGLFQTDSRPVIGAWLYRQSAVGAPNGVPEPAGLALLGLGLVATQRMRAKRSA